MANNCIIPNADTSRIREAICIDTKRIYDSCVSKDCLEDLRVTFHSRSQELIDCAVLVKCKECEIITTLIDVQEVPFNHGFYSVDISYFFKLKFDTFRCPTAAPETAIGFAKFSKKCILYGGEGNVKVYSSSCQQNGTEENDATEYCNPNVKVQLVDPVVLSTDVVEVCACKIPCCCCFPRSVTSLIEDTLSVNGGQKAVLVTLGIFSIVQIERDVQVLVPAYDYCIPNHECCCDNENPCDTFSKISFPMDEFFPKDRKVGDCENNDDPCCKLENLAE